MANYNLITNYIYLYHINRYILLPTYPESVQDSLSSTFNSSTPLARSAPIFSYSHSGPRSMTINLSLHRDMMYAINRAINNQTLTISDLANGDQQLSSTNPLSKTGIVSLEDFGEIGDDYVDVMIKLLQSIALPVYNSHTKLVNPPMIALRLGDEIFIKGIVNGGVTVTYNMPILTNNKYARVDVSFQVTEVDPYDADTVVQQGSFRGLNKTLERQVFKS